MSGFQLKFATGFKFITVICLEIVSVAPSLSVTVSVTVYVPLSLYWCVGFCSVLVFPSPKSQVWFIIVPSVS